MKSNATKLSLCLIAVGFASALGWIAVRSQQKPAGSTYTQFIQQVRMGRVDSVTITSANAGAVPASYRLKNGNTASTILPSDYRDALAAMVESSVEVDIQESTWSAIRPFANAIPFFVLLTVWLIAVRKLKNGTRFA